MLIADLFPFAGKLQEQSRAFLIIISNIFQKIKIKPYGKQYLCRNYNNCLGFSFDSPLFFLRFSLYKNPKRSKKRFGFLYRKAGGSERVRRLFCVFCCGMKRIVYKSVDFSSK